LEKQKDVVCSIFVGAKVTEGLVGTLIVEELDAVACEVPDGW
jgi:hypothetical protein